MRHKEKREAEQQRVAVREESHNERRRKHSPVRLQPILFCPLETNTTSINKQADEYTSSRAAQGQPNLR